MPSTTKWWRIYRHRNALFIHAYLKEHPCVDCGESDPVVLEFDHVRGVKAVKISRLLGGTPSLASLRAEMSKCDVRCAT